MKDLTVRIVRIRNEALGVKSFELADVDDVALPAFTPGAHVDICISPTVVRQYSLCGPLDDSSRYLIAVKQEEPSRGGSTAMHALAEGDCLRIAAVRNNFPLVDDATHHVLLAGGIGITPLLAHARQLARRGASFELHYFSRSQEHAAFHALLGGPEFGDKVQFHFGLAPQEVKQALAVPLSGRKPRAHLYLCGPRPFMDLVLESAAAAGWMDFQVHKEHFAAGPQGGDDSSAFTVRLARSGVELEVAPGQSIVEALAARGITVPTSCQAGVCGTCLTKVLQGQPDHRDEFLSESEKRAGDLMLLCVSRSHSPLLVLDL